MGGERLCSTRARGGRTRNPPEKIERRGALTPMRGASRPTPERFGGFLAVP
jgi:hypothetical protein